MSIQCGVAELVRVDGRPDVYRGEIDFWNVKGEFYLIPHAERRSDRSPEYAFKLAGPGGQFDQVGNAWRKALKAGGFFFSITIDHPQVTQDVLYLSAFPDDDQPAGVDPGEPEQFTLTYSRPRRTVGGAANGGSAASPVADAIPY